MRENEIVNKRCSACNHVYLARFHHIGCPMCDSSAWLPAPEIPPKFNPDSDPLLMVLGRIADALEMANGMAVQGALNSRGRGLSMSDAEAIAGCARYLVSASAGLKGAK